MPLKKAVLDETKSAMKSGDKARLTVLRGFSAAIKQREIDEQITLSEAEQLAVLDKQIKQRKDSETQFREASRDDLADKEAYEIGVLSAFLPKQLEETEILEIVEQAIAKVAEDGMTGMPAMGKVMALVKPQVQGKADIGLVSQLVKSKL